MSEFRIFCIGGFVGAGLIAALGNRGFDLAPGTAWEQMATFAFVVGCATVACFGRRAK